MRGEKIESKKRPVETVEKKEKLPEEELPPNVKEIETQNAKIRIAYERHDGIERKPEELGDNYDAWVPEIMGIDYTLSKKIVERDFNKIFRKKIPEYRKIFEKIEKEGKPIFLGDITEDKTILLLNKSLRYLESAATGVLVASLVYDFLAGEKLTKIEVLKSIAAVYLYSEAIEAMIDKLSYKLRGGIDEKSISRAIERFLGNLNEKIHPETHFILATLRNSLFAQKMKTIAESLKIQNRKPEIAVTLGAGHHGIEKALLKDDEKRVGLIKKLLSVPAPGLKKIRESIATIAWFDFNKEKGWWELTKQFKDPNLSKIEKIDIERIPVGSPEVNKIRQIKNLPR